jgi:hypothetical protein
MSPKTRKFMRNIEAKALPFTVMALLIIAGLSAVFVLQPQNIVSAASTTDFTSYKKITLDSSQVPSTLTNFPVLINLSSDADLAADCLASGYDIAFFDGTGAGATQYNHEIELFDDSTGQLVAWVNVTSLAHDADTTIYMYYGDSDIGSSAENVTGTWDSNYMAVWHFNEDSGKLLDSTSNGYDGTVTGASQGNVGNIGKYYSFDGDGDYIVIDNLDAVDIGGSGNDWTQHIYGSYSDTTNNCFTSVYTTADVNSWNFQFQNVDGGIMDFLNEYSEDNWVRCIYSHPGIDEDSLFHISYDSNLETVYSYLDGVEQNSTTSSNWESGTSQLSDPFEIGQKGTTDYADLNGMISEVRISSVVRSADWINTEYNNMNNATDGGFFSIGDEQSGTEGTYEISGLDANTRFPFTGEAEDVVWSTTNITMSIHTNVSGTTENCTDIFIDLKDGIDVDIDEEQFALAFINSSDGNWATVSSVLTVTDGGNMTLNATTWATGVAAGWAHGTNPFPIDDTNATIDVRMRVTIPAGKTTGTYDASDWEVVWKTIS